MFLNKKTFKVISNVGVDLGMTSPMKLGGTFHSIRTSSVTYNLMSHQQWKHDYQTAIKCCTQPFFIHWNVN